MGDPQATIGFKTKNASMTWKIWYPDDKTETS